MALLLATFHRVRSQGEEDIVHASWSVPAQKLLFRPAPWIQR